MSTYKQGQDWQRNKNENTWARLKVQELEAHVAQLQDTIEDLHQEMRLMQEDAEHVDEVIDEILDEDEGEDITVSHCKFCGKELQWSNLALANLHVDGGFRICGVAHDPSGNEY